MQNIRHLRTLTHLARPRLETHFYQNVADDLQVLFYKHDVIPRAYEKKEVSMRDLFAVPLEDLKTKPAGGTVTSIDSVLPKDPKPPRVRRMRQHPLDLLLPKQIPVEKVDMKPIETNYVIPIPQLKRVVLKVLTFDAIGNKYVHVDQGSVR